MLHQISENYSATEMNSYISMGNHILKLNWRSRLRCWYNPNKSNIIYIIR